MPKLLAPVRWLLVLAASLFWPLALSAAPVVIVIDNYVVSVGKRANYFDGKLLTTGDLSGDQDYKRGTDSFLGDPYQKLGELNLTLDDLFGAAGRGDVHLTFDCAILNCFSRGEPGNLHDPHHEDMIFLDPYEGTWFGRLYLKGVGDIVDGVYDVRSGTFDQFVSVDEPASTALVGLALVGLVAVRRRSMSSSRQTHTSAPG